MKSKMCYLGRFSFLVFASFLYIDTAEAQSHAQDLLKRHNELSSFQGLLQSSPKLLKTLEYKEGTLFAPNNKAIRDFQNSQGKMDNNTLLYHFSNAAKKTIELEDVLQSELPGNPPIWVTRKSDNEIYLNDARLELRTKIGSVRMAEGEEQVVYMIDRVLEPAFPQSPNSSLYNPTARTLLERSGEFNITGQHRTTEFAKQVAALGKLDMFKRPGRHTFFIPVDEAFKSITIKSVDAKVVEGHVIPDHVLFLRSAAMGKEFETTALASNLPVFVTFERRSENNEDKYTVKSETKSSDGDAFHRRGVVQTEVVKGNIPVKNGVVHLISKPLVLIDKTVFETLKSDKESGPTHEFFKLINDYATEEMINIISNPNPHGITLFVPTNEALKKPKLEILKSNRTQLNEVLRLHVVLRTVSSDNITGGSINEREPYQVPTLDHHKKLFFNMVQQGNDRQLFVEGGGVNATITTPDIGATNGVIHMIDRVLGLSDQNVYEKLKTDPMLQKTFQLTSQDGYNQMFNDPNKRFTLFAPSNLAWEKIYRKAPSEYKKLYMGVYGYHVARIIERHTMVNQVFRIEELRDLSKNASDGMYPIPAIHGYLRVKHKDDIDHRKKDIENRQGLYASNINGAPFFNYDYVVFWNYEIAQVIRPNIECTNGIIHIIDNVLMKPGDVTINGAPSISSFLPLCLLVLLFRLF